VLTREHGRVHLLARGAHRPRSRFFAVLDLFDTLELGWSEHPHRELAELRAGDVARRRRGVTRSLERYRAGASILELAELGSHPHQADPALFDLVERALDALADERRPPARTLVVFELGFLQNHGLAPALVRCAACGGAAPPLPGPRDAAPRAAFSATSGGRLCARCAELARAGGRRVGTLPVDVLEAAEGLRRGDAPAAPLDPGLLTRVRDFVERFLCTHLDSLPRSFQRFLAAPNRNARPEN
jgi:DNA repair protein RecO